ncbi:alpha/beta fold hydrolase [Shouchella patagoniensis]|uniref:alpha/beta fold hydrolase n=1 Tax=Shouchella patagoniensis TaxID=228576 RepID=UPI0009958B79|nr:alpha/beta fold hydrolase [Shouchella patagoniensis]
MIKKIVNKKTLLILGCIVLICLLSFFVWTQFTYKLIDDPTIVLDEEVQLENDWLVYTVDDATTGLILYPGAKVLPEAYAYLAQEVSKQGISVAIPTVTLNLPIVDQSKAAEFIERNDEMEWFIGGHSMGGAAAAMYADQHLDKVNGLILLGAYAADNDDLKNSDLPVLSISGSEDGLSTPEKVENMSDYLPNTTEFVEIDGGNHAYFGVYGSQSGDNEAEITVGEQQSIIVKTMVDWIKQHQTGSEKP